MNERIKDIIELLEDAPVKNGKILDVGLGKGEISDWFLNVQGNEVSTIGLEIASYGINKKILDKGIHLVKTSVENMPFEDDIFDVVAASHILEHIDNMKNALDEIRRILKLGDGCIFLYLIGQRLCVQGT